MDFLLFFRSNIRSDKKNVTSNKFWWFNYYKSKQINNGIKLRNKYPKCYVEKVVGNIFLIHLPVLLESKNVHLSILLLHLPMLFDLYKYTEFGELKNGEYF